MNLGVIKKLENDKLFLTKTKPLIYIDYKLKTNKQL